MAGAAPLRHLSLRDLVIMAVILAIAAAVWGTTVLIGRIIARRKAASAPIDQHRLPGRPKAR